MLPGRCVNSSQIPFQTDLASQEASHINLKSLSCLKGQDGLRVEVAQKELENLGFNASFVVNLPGDLWQVNKHPSVFNSLSIKWLSTMTVFSKNTEILWELPRCNTESALKWFSNRVNLKNYLKVFKSCLVFWCGGILFQEIMYFFSK